MSAEQPINASDCKQDALDPAIALLQRIDIAPSILEAICKHTGLGFAVIARVTDTHWTACLVHDTIGFGLRAGDELELATTLCMQARIARRPLAMDQASIDPVYANHATPRLYGFESYVSVPIILQDDEYFGNLCAIDPKPFVVSDARTLSMFSAFAELIGLQLIQQRKLECAQAVLARQRQELALREALIASLGHDLLNPVSALSANAQMLARRDLQIPVTEIARRMGATTQRMSRLIKDVVDFANAGSDKGLPMCLEMTDDLELALRDVLNEVQGNHPDRQIVQHVTPLGTLRCDRTRLQQMLFHLMVYGLREGRREAPMMVEVGCDAVHLRVAVTTYGRALTQTDLRDLFQAYRADGASQSRGGLGFGLFLAAEIAKSHGGRLEASSDAAAGTQFVALLPVVERSPATPSVGAD